MSRLVALMGATGLWLLFWGCTGAARVSEARMTSSSFTGRVRSQLGTGPLVLSLTLGVVVATLALAAGGPSVVPILAGTVAASLALASSRTARRRRRESLNEAWPDALSSMIAGIRAGMALPVCCCALAERGPEPLRAGFAAFASTYTACGNFPAALERLRGELQDPVTDRVALVLDLAYQVGGTDLVRVLRATCDFVRADLRTRGEVRARWSWTLNAARVAAGTPFAVLVVMGLRPEARLAYASPSGVMTVVVGSVVTLIGYRLMLRAGRLPEERRLG